MQYFLNYHTAQMHVGQGFYKGMMFDKSAVNTALQAEISHQQGFQRCLVRILYSQGFRSTGW